MLTYSVAENMMTRARCGRRKLGNNTYLYRRGDSYAVQLHGTDVVTINRDGTYVLDSGSWRTSTTKNRINEFAPAGIYQRDYVWYMDTRHGTVVFQDGMVVTGS